MDLLKKISIKLSPLDRRAIFLLVGLAVLLPLLYPEYVSLPVRPKPHSTLVFEELNKLEAGDKVLLSFEYGPSTMPEIHPMAIGVLRHLFAKNVLVYGFALWPDGNFMSTRAFSKVADELKKEYEKN